MGTFPKEWIPSSGHAKNGWKNNPKILSEITTAVNEDTYIEDETAFMEELDLVLEYLKSKYKIEKLKP